MEKILSKINCFLSFPYYLYIVYFFSIWQYKILQDQENFQYFIDILGSNIYCLHEKCSKFFRDNELQDIDHGSIKFCFEIFN